MLIKRWLAIFNDRLQIEIILAPSSSSFGAESNKIRVDGICIFLLHFPASLAPMSWSLRIFRMENFLRFWQAGLCSFMKNKCILSGLLILGMACAAVASQPTAFDLMKRGDDYVGVQSKDRVVQIRSEKSVASLTPDIWYVVYYDPDATLKAVQVKFGAGQEMEVTHPLRLLEPVTGEDKVLDSSKLKVDSDQAQATALDQPLLKNLTIKATQLWLMHGDVGPEWKVKLWAAKVNDPSQSADVGDVYISAADGSIDKVDLHPNSAD